MREIFSFFLLDLISQIALLNKFLRHFSLMIKYLAQNFEFTYAHVWMGIYIF